VRWTWLAACALVATSARATDVDGSGVARLAAGPPQSIARADRGRTGRVPRLPSEPTLAWRARVNGGLAAAIAPTATGAWAATADGDLALLDERGAERGRVALGGPAVFSPVVTPAGDAIVVTEAGDVICVKPSGRVRFRVRLDGQSRDLRTLPLPMADGGVVVARGTTMVRFDDTGAEVARARAPEGLVGALLGDGPVVLATTDSGKVVRWSPDAAPRVVARLGGLPTTTAALSGRTLAAVVDGHRLVLLDVLAGTTTALDVSGTLDAPSIGPAGTIVIGTSAGTVLTLSPEGRELSHVSLPPMPATSLPASDPPFLVDDEARVAFARSGGDVGVITAGNVALADERACATPIGLGEANGRLFVSCRDGVVAAYAAR
jgi:hypothetical protein